MRGTMGEQRTVDLGINGLSTAVHLGAGGSANVFAAHLDTTGEPVAVKLLRASADSDKDRQRFEREQVALNKLSTQDGVVPILDAGLTDRHEPYFLMPLMDGSLQDRIESDGALDWRTAGEVMVQVAETVDFAHGENVLHRDLKPGNILVDSDGVPRVADFGIAKLLDAGVSKSSTSMGTPSFMPPERFSGEEATKSSDVYGLGATFAALVTGMPPFTTGENDTDAAVMMRVVSEDPPDLTTLDVPDEIAGLVSASMAKDPTTRPSTASEFARKLRQALRAAGAEPPSSPVTVAVPHRDLAIPGTGSPSDDNDGDGRSKRGWLLAAAILLLFGGAAGAFIGLNRPDPVEVEVAGEVEDAVDPIDASPSSDPGGETDDEETPVGETESDQTRDNSAPYTDRNADVDENYDGSLGIDERSEEELETASAQPRRTSDDTEPAPATADPPASTPDEETQEPTGSVVVDPPAENEEDPDPVIVDPPVDNEEDPDPVIVDPPIEEEPDPPADPPMACFSASSSSVETGTSVSFSNCSTDAASYSWDFGDGASSSMSNPSHSWSSAGVYTVRLTVTGEGGSHSTTRAVTVTPPTPCVGPDASDHWFTLASNQDYVSGDMVTGSATNARWLNDSSGGTLPSTHHSLTWEGLFSHSRQSDSAYSFWVDFELVDAAGCSGDPGRIFVDVHEKTASAPDDRTASLTMAASQTQIDTNLLAAGGNSARWIGGDDKHALYGTGRYLYDREDNGASTHSFQFYELLNGEPIVRWTITVHVAAYSG